MVGCCTGLRMLCRWGAACATLQENLSQQDPPTRTTTFSPAPASLPIPSSAIAHTLLKRVNCVQLGALQHATARQRPGRLISKLH